MLINLSIEEDDVNFTSIENVSTAGSRVSPLQSPAVVFFDEKINLWGGLNVSYYRTENEFVIFSPEQKSSDKYKVDIISSCPEFSPHQSGDIPFGRTGHIMELMSKKAIMFGGISMLNRDNPISPTPFSISLSDPFVYVVDLVTYKWTKTVSLTPRAYHSSCIKTYEDSSKIFITGGITFTDPNVVNCLPVNDVLVLDINFQDDDEPTIAVSPVFCHMDIKVNNSYHASQFFDDNNIIILRGFDQSPSKTKFDAS